MASFHFDETGDISVKNGSSMTYVKNNYKETIINELKVIILENFAFDSGILEGILKGKRENEEIMETFEKILDSVISDKVNEDLSPFLKRKVAVYGSKVLLLFFYDDKTNKVPILSKTIEI